jgi:hypothetical protein
MQKFGFDLIASSASAFLCGFIGPYLSTIFSFFLPFFGRRLTKENWRLMKKKSPTAFGFLSSLFASCLAAFICLRQLEYMPGVVAMLFVLGVSASMKSKAKN